MDGMIQGTIRVTGGWILAVSNHSYIDLEPTLAGREARGDLREERFGFAVPFLEDLVVEFFFLLVGGLRVHHKVLINNGHVHMRMHGQNGLAITRTHLGKMYWIT